MRDEAAGDARSPLPAAAVIKRDSLVIASDTSNGRRRPESSPCTAAVIKRDSLVIPSDTSNGKFGQFPRQCNPPNEPN